MPQREVWIADNSPATTATAVDTIERASTEVSTTLTADPGASGTTLAVTANAKFPGTNNFKVRVEDEVMLVTAGAGTNSWTVTRAQDGTTGVAHAIGTVVAQVVAVQRVEPVVASHQVTYKGRVSTFRTPGRAGTTGQKIFAIHNATGSKTLVDVEKITVDCLQAAAAGQAPTVLPAVVRAWKFTAVPTNGTNLTKVPEDSGLSSNSSVTVWGDASADGTGSATTLTVTLPAGTIITQEYAPRMLVVGTSASTLYEPFDRTTFFEDEAVAITLRPLEGLAIFLDYTAATANPTTNHWLVSARWTEWTAA